MGRVVHEAHAEGRHLRLDRLARVAGHDHHLVHARARQRDELPADERHALQPDQRLGDAAHAQAGAGGQQHGADAQPGVQAAALLEQASHGVIPSAADASR
jgi:hypothetical protein